MQDNLGISTKDNFLNRFYSFEIEETFFENPNTFYIFYLAKIPIVYSLAHTNMGDTYTRLVSKLEFILLLADLYPDDLYLKVSQTINETSTFIVNSEDIIEYTNLSFFLREIFHISDTNQNSRLIFFENSWSFKKDFVEIIISDKNIILTFGRGREQYKLQNCKEVFLIRFKEQIDLGSQIKLLPLDIRINKYYEMGAI